MKRSPQHTDYDVIIVGRGLVGAYAAYTLSKHSLKIAIIEAKAPQPSDTPIDLRVSAVTLANQRLFAANNVWQDMASHASPFRHMHVWDNQGGNSGELHFDSADIGEVALGYIIENRIMQQAFDNAIAQQPLITEYMPARCKTLNISDSQVNLLLEDGRELTSQLIIGADGSQSWLRQSAQIAVRGWDYDHHALVTYVKTEKSHEETAAQRFLATGPLAFLPLLDGYSSIVWSTSPAEATRLKNLTANDFKTELANAFEHRLGAIQDVGPRAAFPLRFFMTDAYIKPRLVLVGDAAHTIHPLAGQGVNLGFADVQTLNETLQQAIANQLSIGDFSVLRNYERARKADNLPMLVAVDSLQRLFGSQLSPLQTIRTAGMSMLNRLTPLKNKIIAQAMGL